MIAEGSKDYAFKMIDPAVVPEVKTKPKRFLIIGVGFALGFIISSLYALAKQSKL